MSGRKTSEPVPDERGNETHPAFGRIAASRVSNSGPGSVLFDSDIRHGHSVVIRLSRADRRRDLNRDWVHETKVIAEVEMSQAQWAEFVSSMNAGGSSCTIRAIPGDWQVDALPYAPRMQLHLDEVAKTADKAVERIKEALAAYKAHKTVANLRQLELAVDGMTPNMTYAATSLTDYAEGVVSRSKADIEAMALDAARRNGITPQELIGPGPVLEIGQGEENTP